jgi:hypothetical protein
MIQVCVTFSSCPQPVRAAVCRAYGEFPLRPAIPHRHHWASTSAITSTCVRTRLQRRWPAVVLLAPGKDGRLLACSYNGACSHAASVHENPIDVLTGFIATLQHRWIRNATSNCIQRTASAIMRLTCASPVMQGCLVAQAIIIDDPRHQLSTHSLKYRKTNDG